MWSKPKPKHTAKHTFPDPIASSNPYEYLSDSQEQEYQSAPYHGKYKTRVYGYAGMTNDCTVGGLREIFMRD